jgi:hypothetical protein
MSLWMVSFAVAAPPISLVENGDELRVSAVVDAPLDAVVEFLRDPRLPAALSDTGDVHIVPRADGCFDHTFHMSYGVLALGYFAQSCPTASGSSTRLVSSDSFRELAFRWDARTVPTGTEISYTYRAVLDLPLPDWVIRQSTRKATIKVVERVAEQF